MNNKHKFGTRGVTLKKLNHRGLNKKRYKIKGRFKIYLKYEKGGIVDF